MYTQHRDRNKKFENGISVRTDIRKWWRNKLHKSKALCVVE